MLLNDTFEQLYDLQLIIQPVPSVAKLGRVPVILSSAEIMSLMKRLLLLNVLFQCETSFAEVEYLGFRKKLVLYHLHDHNNSTIQKTKTSY